MRKIRIIIFAVLMMLPMFFAKDNSVKAAAYYPQQVTEGYLTFQLQSGKNSYFVTSCSSWDAEGELFIPEQVCGLPVTGIGCQAFFDCSGLTKIHIPSTVLVIEDYAFDFCQGLTEIVIPASVTTIGEIPFSGCWALERIRVDENNLNYSSDSAGVLHNKDKTKLIYAPTGLRDTYTIADTVTQIEAWAFSECFYLQFNTYDGVKYIGTNSNPYFALTECSDEVTSCQIHPDAKVIVGGAFYACDVLTDVHYSGTKAQWEAVSVGEDNESLLKAVMHFASCTENHIYDNDFDADCNICDAVREVKGTFTVTNNCVVITDNNTANINHRLVCYYLEDKTVTDINDETALKAIDPNPVTYWGLDKINKLILQKPGNYALLLNYNEGKSVKKTVAQFAQTTAMSVPVIEGLGADYKLVVTDADTTHINHRATAYYLGEKTVDTYDEAQLKTIDPNAATYWGLAKINKLQLRKKGNYAIVLHYNLSNGAKRTVTATVTVDLELPAIKVQDGKLMVEDAKNQYINHRATVYYLADVDIADIYDEAALKNIDPTATTRWGLNKINKAVLDKPGNYVVVLHYNLPNSGKMTVAASVNI